ncbi:MAG: YceH family protein [Planctomycetales bacterium]|nr:YceH family protein [Planctomycetales bacterium]
MADDTDNGEPQIQPKWRPLGRYERRVLGVLVEKAKTTPDAYPMTLNGLTSGCNQKSNRDPQMNLQPEQVENALEKLRHLSAVIEVSGGGRVAKYRHMIYEWMGVSKVEAAVMTELLLRGAQTVGELRGRAARMDPIPDVAALQPILQSLIDKKLVISLTPAGRGQIVTHALYTLDELEKIRAVSAAAYVPDAAPPVPATPSHPTSASTSAPAAPPGASPPASAAPNSTVNDGWQAELAELRSEVKTLRSELDRVKSDLQDLWNSLN